MIQGQSVLALIPARGGSKQLPRKNILRIGGRPLLAWTAAAAVGSQYVDRVVVSSEDEEIIAAAVECGCDAPFRRPRELASDTSAAIDVALHALDELPGYDILLLLQPTSPLRGAGDIDAALELMVSRRATSCVSVSFAEQSPYWMYLLDERGVLRPVVEVPSGYLRRQDLPAVYCLNGAIYAADVRHLRKAKAFVTADTVAYVMPPERSLDIDTQDDFDAFCRIVSTT